MSQADPTIPVPGVPAANSEAGRRGRSLVLLAGLATTALTLYGVWWLDNNTKDFRVMGWYANYIIPAGAILVGMAAGSGYGIVSYLTGFRIRRGLLWLVLALQLGGYFGAQYLEFRSLTREGPLVNAEGEELTFARYYHLRAMSFAWEDHGKPGEPIGAWGYLFLGLGVLGFAGAGLIAPAALMKMPYCERCEMYMKTRTLALVPASARARRISKKDAAGQAAFAAENERAAAVAGDTLERVTGLAARSDAPRIKSALAGFPARGPDARAADRLPARLRVGLVRCRQCSDGYLQPSMITGQGRGIKVKALARVPLQSDAVRVIGET
jgi:hypothetical protein